MFGADELRINRDRLDAADLRGRRALSLPLLTRDGDSEPSGAVRTAW